VILFWIYCLLIVIASFTGGLLPGMLKMTHRRTQMILSMVAGVMLGVGILHLLPQAVQQLDELQWAFGSALAGLLFMFFLIRLFNFHQHDQPCEGEACDDHHHHQHLQRDFSWTGLLFGLGIHTLLDGIALAVAFDSESTEGRFLPAVGIFLAVMLHKPLDALSITALMQAKRISRFQQNTVNAGFALLCPLGAMLAISGLAQLSDSQALIQGVGLGFASGVFICISLSDLLPEVQFHSHDRFALSGMLLLGIAVAVGIEFLPGR